jgi:hypothetical protein
MPPATAPAALLLLLLLDPLLPPPPGVAAARSMYGSTSRTNTSRMGLSPASPLRMLAMVCTLAARRRSAASTDTLGSALVVAASPVAAAAPAAAVLGAIESTRAPMTEPSHHVDDAAGVAAARAIDA